MPTESIDNTPVVLKPIPQTRIPEAGRLQHVAARAAAAWRFIAHSRPLAFLVFFAIYTGPTIYLARQKLLWDDEFFTLYLSTTSTWRELIKALSTGADQHPPSFYYLTHLIFNTFGITPVTIRLTAIAGFAVMCICLYEIASNITNREWGFIAMFLPLTCTYYLYAMEARGYGIQLAFVVLAFWMWTLAARWKHRRLTIPILAAALCGAVGSHYYAIFVLLPLAAGELTRTIMKRRIDWPVWFAFCGAMVPLAAFSRVILSAHSYSEHFWAVPRWRAMASWYPNATTYVLAIILGICVMRLIQARGRRIFVTERPFRIDLPQTVALVVLALLPVVEVFIAKFVTHAFTDRYAIAAFPAVCILLVLGMRRMTRQSAAVWLSLILCFPAVSYRHEESQRLDYEDIKETAAFLRRHENLPIAMSDVTRFHRISFYARRDLSRRIVYLAEPASSIRYLGYDTVDRGMLHLNPWFPLNVRWMDEWIAEHPSLLVWGFIGNW